MKDLVGLEMERLRDVSSEKFESLFRHLGLVEQQRVEQKADTKAAVDAALTAQKEAVKEQTTASERAIAKSEAATTKQLEQLNATFATAIKGVTDLLQDTKDRVGRIEALKAGSAETTSSQRLNIGVVVGIGGLALAILATAVTLATALTR